MNNLHKYVGKDLNKLRLHLINKLNKDNKFKNYLFEIAKREIFEIVGNELAMQKILIYLYSVQMTIVHYYQFTLILGLVIHPLSLFYGFLSWIAVKRNQCSY